MIETKSDQQVLTEAIISLEQEGMWCQEVWVKTENRPIGKALRDEWVDDHSLIIGMCAEGAIRLANGFYEMTVQEDGMDGAHPQREFFGQQASRVEVLVASKIRDLCPDISALSLNSYNDAEGMTAETIILGMKHAREVASDAKPL